MSTTIDHARGWLGGLALVVAAWVAVMLALPFVGPSGRLVAVVGDGPDAVRQIMVAGGRVIDIRDGVTLARGGPGFAANLYQAGAPLVLEGRTTAGCLGRVTAGGPSNAGA